MQDAPSHTGTGICFDYIQGVADTIQNGVAYYVDTGLSVCVPQDVKISRLVNTFLYYADDHPGLTHLPATQLIRDAWHDAFPCKKN
jgi:hypothetical protein